MPSSGQAQNVNRQPRRILIVGPQAAAAVSGPCFGRISGPERSLAGAALRLMHDQHIGVTPELCGDLALLFSDSRQGRRSAGYWAPLIDHLTRAYLGDSESEIASAGNRDGVGKGFDIAAASFYFLARVVAPLVARATEDIGLAYLFAAASDQEDPPPGFHSAYADYAGRVRDRVLELVTGEEMPELFWTDAAYTLIGLSRPHSDHDWVGSELPRVDEVGLAHLDRLRPELANRRSPRRPLGRPMTDAPRLRALLHRNEGGVDGIHITRRLSDLQNILISEFLNPPALLLDRLVRSGYLALRRPPSKEKKRDVLIVGVLPRPPREFSASAVAIALAKASWLDCMMRLAIWLQQVGLRRSEVRWIEADRCDRMVSHRCLLEATPIVPPDDQPSAGWRREFLSSFAWLPGFLDRHALSSWPAKGQRGDAQPGDGALTSWAAAAWRSQRDHPGWQWNQRHLAGPASTGTALRWQEFGFVQVMVFLPRVESEPTWPGAVQHRFGLPPKQGNSLNITWLPALATDCSSTSGWEVSARGRRKYISWRSEEDSRQNLDGALENRIAARLETVWLELFFEELLRD